MLPIAGLSLKLKTGSSTNEAFLQNSNDLSAVSVWGFRKLYSHSYGYHCNLKKCILLSCEFTFGCKCFELTCFFCCVKIISVCIVT